MMFSTFVLAAVAALSPIRDGERIVYFGDSITHGGWQTDFTQLYCALRRPGAGIRVYNCGIGGDAAGGAKRRVKPDVAVYRPDRVFLMLGMNDAGLYVYRQEETPEIRKRKAQFIASYETNMTTLVTMLRDVTKETVLITPSPYDEYSPGGTNRGERTINVAKTYNDFALSACADHVRAIADREGTGLVELHRPLTATVKAHPELIICGYDRIHPGDTGHLFLVGTVLDALGEKPELSDVTFDAKGAASFAADYAPAALPFPYLNCTPWVEKIYPFTDRHNVERLTVKNLAEGTYVLKADGKPFATFTSAQLAAGVNIATNGTPNQLIARKAYDKIVYPMHTKEYQRRDYECQLYRELRTQGYVDGDYASATSALARVEAFFRQRTKHDEKWYEQRRKSWAFAMDRRNIDALEEEIEAYRKQLDALRPVTWKLEIVKNADR